MEQENLAIEEIDENVDTQTTEENEEGIELTDTSDTGEEKEPEEETKEVKTYTQEELDKIVQTRLTRERRNLERDYNKEIQKYKRTEEILNAGLGTKTIDEANNKMLDYYKQEGIQIPEVKQGLSPKQIEILARAEAEEIISVGDEREELNRLLKIEIKDMTPEQKIIYQKLYEKVSADDRKAELVEQGIDLSILNEKDFQEFEKKFSKETKLTDVVNLYRKLNPVETPGKIGSMKSDSKTNKDYFTEEDVLALTPEDWEKPGVWEKVMASQKKWK